MPPQTTVTETKTTKTTTNKTGEKTINVITTQPPPGTTGTVITKKFTVTRENTFGPGVPPDNGTVNAKLEVKTVKIIGKGGESPPGVMPVDFVVQDTTGDALQGGPDNPLLETPGFAP